MYVFLKNENGGVLERNQDNMEIVRRQEGKNRPKRKKVVCKIHRRTGGTSGRTEMIVEYHEGSAGKKGRKRTK